MTDVSNEKDDKKVELDENIDISDKPESPNIKTNDPLEIEIRSSEKNESSESNLLEFLQTEFEEYIDNKNLCEKIASYKNILIEMKMFYEKKDVLSSQLTEKNLLLIKYESENEASDAIIKNLHKKIKILETNASDNRNESENLKSHRDKLLEKIQTQSNEILEKNKKIDQLNEFLRKLIKIYDIHKDINMFDFFEIVIGFEKERKRTLKAYKNLLTEKQDLIEQNISLQEIITNRNSDISKLKITIDQHTINVVSKEQEILKLQRELERTKFAKLVSHEILNHTVQISSNFIKCEATYKKLLKIYKCKLREINDLNDSKNDLIIQKDLLAGINKDLNSKNQKNVIDLKFTIESLYQATDQSYYASKIHADVHNRYISCFNELKIIKEKISKQSNYFSNKRYQSIINDLKNEINDMKIVNDIDDNQLHLQAEISSLNEDIKILKEELVERNKLVDFLLKTDTNSYVEHDKTNTWVFEQIFYPRQYDLNLSIINESLKNSLEESIMKNILLKENIRALGLEIDKLNQKIKNI